MSDDSGPEHDEHKTRQSTHNRGVEPGADVGIAEATENPLAYSSALLGDPRLNGRGNAPVRAAVLQRMQQNYGNRYTQRFLQRAASVGTTTMQEEIGARDGGIKSAGSLEPPGARDSETDPLTGLEGAETGEQGRAEAAFKFGRFGQAAPSAVYRVASASNRVTSGEGTGIGAASQAAPVQRRTRPGVLSVQRYQPGEVGHGGVEKKAMQQAGFSAQEANQIYFGNWLRDYSQLVPKLDKKPEMKPKLVEVLNVLSLGEFNREFTMNDLGTYVGFEHIDNPAGTGTIDDPEVQKDEGRKAAAYNNLTPKQREMYDEVQRRFANQEDKSAGALPVYVQKAKIRTQIRLEESIRAGNSPDGTLALGDALHVVEDYFSHSNFVSVAITVLRREKKLPPSLAEAKAKADAVAQVDTAMPDAKDKPQIITGTYAAGSDAYVSILEALKTALNSNEMSQALVKGILRRLGITPDQIAQSLGTKAGSVVGGELGELAGSVVGGVSGAYGGASEGWNKNSGWRALAGAAEGLVTGGSSGSATGAAEGRKAGATGGGIIGGEIGKMLGSSSNLANKSLEEILKISGVAAIVKAFPAINVKKMALEALLDEVIAYLTQKSGEEAKELAKKEGLEPGTKASLAGGPTHSQLSKDSPEAALYNASRALAMVADKEIGQAVRTLWQEQAKAAPGGSSAAPSTPAAPAQTPAPANGKTGPGSSPLHLPPPPGAEKVTKLVDKFISSPDSTDNRWWEQVLVDAAKGK